ncbi:hypothetical protein CTI12_AA096170 [Artemisia annua]|uniref:Uncharacterized protein n=1 Tax=Artemisia annua TaxID=35608 RepID=A0A2U1PYG2_ARTAN|nr:hypothetical protein CTI12_AA096170 [Artemisia annua]
MKGTSNLIMWLTFVLVVSLAMVLGLVLLLLAELYCWPVIRRLRRRRISTPNGAPMTTTTILSPSLLESQETENDVEKQCLDDNVDIQKDCLNDSFNGSSLVYISNPVFDNENVTKSTIVDDIDQNVGTPFETPDSSPSRLETEDSDDESHEMEEISSKVVLTPSLSSTKKPAMDASLACSKDESIGTSLSETNSTNGVMSSNLLTPCTSPSL